MSRHCKPRPRDQVPLHRVRSTERDTGVLRIWQRASCIKPACPPQCRVPRSAKSWCYEGAVQRCGTMKRRGSPGPIGGSCDDRAISIRTSRVGRVRSGRMRRQIAQLYWRAISAGNVRIPDRDPDYARIKKNRADCSRKLIVMPELVFSSTAPRLLSFDRRDQFSASAIQRVRFAGSRLASCLQSSARELSSN